MSTTDEIRSLARDNLYLVFGERDVSKRLAQLSRLFAPAPQVLFVDATSVCRTHEAISDFVSSLLEKTPGFAFSELGKLLPQTSFPQTLIVLHQDR